MFVYFSHRQTFEPTFQWLSNWKLWKVSSGFALMWTNEKTAKHLYKESTFGFCFSHIINCAECRVWGLPSFFFSFSKHLYDTIFIIALYICTWKQKNIKWSFPVESREAFFKCTFHILQCLIRNIWGKCGLTRLSYTHSEKVCMLLLFRTNKVFF